MNSKETEPFLSIPDGSREEIGEGAGEGDQPHGDGTAPSGQVIKCLRGSAGLWGGGDGEYEQWIREGLP